MSEIHQLDELDWE